MLPLLLVKVEAFAFSIGLAFLLEARATSQFNPGKLNHIGTTCDFEGNDSQSTTWWGQQCRFEEWPIGFNCKSSSATQTQMCGEREGSEQERVVPPGLERFRGCELHHEPGAWLLPDFLHESLADHILSLAPSTSSDAWGSCPGSVHYGVRGKRCAHVEVNSSKVEVKRLFEQIEQLWGITMPRPNSELVWLPMLHYAPGTTAIAAHADKYVSADGTSDGGPDVSLVIYLTDTPAGTAQTTFPNTGVEVQPRKGTVLTWLNVDARTGLPHRNALPAWEPVPLYSPDRIALCIPVRLFDKSGAKRPHVRTDLKSEVSNPDENVIMVAGWAPPPTITETTTTTTTATATTATTTSTSTTSTTTTIITTSTTTTVMTTTPTSTTSTTTVTSTTSTTTSTATTATTTSTSTTSTTTTIITTSTTTTVITTSTTSTTSATTVTSTTSTTTSTQQLQQLQRLHRLHRLQRP
ncbi:unnamed protein product [Polarella glacialis]|uniref:Fe2OG dioxygenase domain-containing protein n=1 Tax=Polarella glacialis TaxID=89957 RepID=A0A813GYQ1_POLGL|nr:unnamed protein product [Polarella glacialis]